MKCKRLFAALLCAAVSLSGCAAQPGGGGGSAVSSKPSGGASEPVRPTSRLDQLAFQAGLWEAAGTIPDEGAYQAALLETAELTRTEDRGAYLCEGGNPNRLDEAKQAALKDAAMRCHYLYSISLQFEPYSKDDLGGTIAMLLIYTPGTLDTHWVMDPPEPYGHYFYVKKDALQPFLDEAVVPAGEAYRMYQDCAPEWGWYEDADGEGLCVNVDGYTATLPYSQPSLNTVKPLGGNRYLVTCDMMPVAGIIEEYEMAFVVEDTALPGEEPHVSVLDCLSASWVNESVELTPDTLEELGDRYRVQDEGSGEALALLQRLEALSPIPFHTDLLPVSPAAERALYEAEEAYEEYHGGIFEDYVAALRVNATEFRYPPDGAWEPMNYDSGCTAGDAWNLIPAAELEEASLRRFGIDLAANDRAWMNDREFVPIEYKSGRPMAEFDGENYIIYMGGRGSPVGDPKLTGLTYHYDGTYTAVFTEDYSDYGGDVSQTSIQMRDLGTEEAPFFQVLGYQLPA